MPSTSIGLIAAAFGCGMPTSSSESWVGRASRHSTTFAAWGEEAVGRGFKAVKTNPIVFGPGGPALLNPGFVLQGLQLERHADEAVIHAIAAQASALREGIGPRSGPDDRCEFRVPTRVATPDRA